MRGSGAASSCISCLMDESIHHAVLPAAQLSLPAPGCLPWPEAGPAQKASPRFSLLRLFQLLIWLFLSAWRGHNRICAPSPLQTFQANEDATEVVLNKIHSPVLTRFVRIRPQSWHNGIALRLELYGCRITGEGPLLPSASALLSVPLTACPVVLSPAAVTAAWGGNSDTVSSMEAPIPRDAPGGQAPRLRRQGGNTQCWYWFSAQSLNLQGKP